MCRGGKVNNERRQHVAACATNVRTGAVAAYKYCTAATSCVRQEPRRIVVGCTSYVDAGLLSAVTVFVWKGTPETFLYALKARNGTTPHYATDERGASKQRVSSVQLPSDGIATHKSELTPPYSPVLLILSLPLFALYVYSLVSYVVNRVLIAPAAWPNALYAADNAHVFYHLHFATFLLWLVILGPCMLVKNVGLPGLYWTTWFTLTVGTALPLLSVTRAKETLGTPAYVAAGVVANAAAAVAAVAIALGVPLYRRFRPHSLAGKQGCFGITAWAFHLFAGYNLAAFGVRYLLVDRAPSHAAQAAWHWALLVYHLCLVVYLLRSNDSTATTPRFGPLRRYTVSTWMVNGALVVLGLVPIVVWRASCANCGRG
ncbi:hypothetical protein DFJ77DRAFT_443532 [Powellomyces hirtus]|nr:hypothetical protein DFJ77DRAFT_443532 [Powellomyces hirtus]